ncbi:GNAT family N-acetyltransferase [Haliea sp. E1-2-M8]|uniref:GNAT family N-acetyltransferase n=1 Tax=Haliea sp. E1-2-M8 TaxID=3064706 RepID=UPI002716D164|nr:GNAT family N-acetyltransferase [Haliea sp. E1-2-M8]MDO8861180.1 GNAT family N-acetyltransferase [Haliea sp. E1-2-M8]
MIAIRPATAADTTAMDRMLRGLAASLGQSDKYLGSSAALALHGFGPEPAFFARLATEDDQAVGMVVYFWEFSTWRAQRGVFIQDLFVNPELRGTGLGKRLLLAAAEHGRSVDAAYLRLSVDNANLGAARFYQRLGFRVMEEDSLMLLHGEAYQALQSGAVS